VVRTIRAKFTNGKIEPLENVDLEEGEEVLVTLELEGTATSRKALVRTAGAWKGSIDFDAYLKDLYAARREPSPGTTLNS
jgi:predicted DNA-binding antitoxin AbrB/MazE fold protein